MTPRRLAVDDHVDRHPDELGRVLAELDALGPPADADAIVELPDLSAVCHEALRIHPILPEIYEGARG